MRKLKKFKINTQNIVAALVIVTIAGIGTNFILSSHAQSPYASAYANSGTLTGSASLQSDSSGNNFVQFGGPTFNVMSFGAVGDGVTDDSAAFQSAINAASAAGGGVVYVPSTSASYYISQQVNLLSNVSIEGEGSTTTKITGGISSGYIFEDSGATNTLTNIGISGLTIDLNYLAQAGGIRVENVNGLNIDDVQVNNVNQWGIVVGVANGSDSNIENNNITINNCSFNGLNSTYEQILLFNSSNVTVKNSKFSNITNSGGSSIGLYQELNNVTIESNTFNLTLGHGSYYSRSVNNVTYSNNVFTGQAGNSSVGIIGANTSDNGTFGQTVVNNYTFNNNTFQNLTEGLQIGALYGSQITGNTFSDNGNALVINDGNGGTGAYYASMSVDIENNIFTDNNSTNNYFAIHPAILFSSNGGLTNESQGIYIQNNQFNDDQTTKTQRYPIGFDGGYSNGSQVNSTWDYLSILSNNLYADTANGGTSLVFSDGANIGSNTLIYQNTNYSGTPNQDTTSSGVSGTINTNTGAYNGNVHISSTNTPQNILVPFSTNAQGQFSISLNPGNYILYTDSSGGSVQQKSFSVVKNQVINLGTITI